MGYFCFFLIDIIRRHSPGQSSESLHFNFEVKLLWKNNFIAILKWSEVILFLRKMKWSEVKLKNITSTEIEVKWNYFSISKFWSEVKWKISLHEKNDFTSVKVKLVSPYSIFNSENYLRALNNRHFERKLDIYGKFS